MIDELKNFNLEKILGTLKNFQRRTVEHIFKKMYGTPNGTNRFLLADEVGLGKTLVAKGVIAKVIDHFKKRIIEDGHRLDILYICSNAAIAKQNVSKLNILNRDNYAQSSRITMLAEKNNESLSLDKNKINFISFTPSTTLDIDSRTGTARERAIIYKLLDEIWHFEKYDKGAVKLLKVGIKSDDNFRNIINSINAIDSSIARSYRENLEHADNIGLKTEFFDLCAKFASCKGNNTDHENHYELKNAQRDVIGRLRTLLAGSCLSAVEPDLIILDEFQRFKHLLSDDVDESHLIRKLFNYVDPKGNPAKLLLLSATPYKMYTFAGEDENHYEDFFQTFNFLAGDSVKCEKFKAAFSEYRKALLEIGSGTSDASIMKVKDDIEKMLKEVMVRTEKLANSEDRAGMLKERIVEDREIEPLSFRDYRTYKKICDHFGHKDPVEYWKSVPYMLNFADEGYNFFNEFTDHSSKSRSRKELQDIVAGDLDIFLRQKDITEYKPIRPGNARMEELLSETVENGAWKLLWLPPAIEYYKPGGPFSNGALKNFTKKLIFTAWKMAPRAIASIVSYEAQRSLHKLYDKNARNDGPFSEKHSGLLKTALEDSGGAGESGGPAKSKRPTGMPVLALLYPCLTLAIKCDPYKLLVQSGSQKALDRDEMLKCAEKIIEDLIGAAEIKGDEHGAEDDRWYWLIPLILDDRLLRSKNQKGLDENLSDYLTPPEDKSKDDDEGEEEKVSEGWEGHIAHAKEIISEFNRGELKLGKMPADLYSVLALLALAGPGISSFRAMTRKVQSGISITDIMQETYWISKKFLSLFNSPEATLIIRGLYSNRDHAASHETRADDPELKRRHAEREKPYWRAVLEYCYDGSLQSVLDEFAHVIYEHKALYGKADHEKVQEIAKAMGNAVRLRVSSLEINDTEAILNGEKSKKLDNFGRTGFAVKYGDEKAEDEKSVMRASDVNDSFNSPFWPFVLVTTSIGQEGIDFHTYCHSLFHWNIPSNPVDLEQREGRIHRYKCHAVRKNVARRYASPSTWNGSSDPWEAMFEEALADIGPDPDHISPYWAFPDPDGAAIERVIPLWPFSKDGVRFTNLKKARAVYRMVLGQPGQEDLVEYLGGADGKASLRPEVLEKLRFEIGPE